VDLEEELVYVVVVLAHLYQVELVYVVKVFLEVHLQLQVLVVEEEVLEVLAKMDKLLFYQVVVDQLMVEQE
jgi:hypothetical protein